MGSVRTYTEDDVRNAVAASRSWRGVMVALGKPATYPNTHVRKLAVELGLDTSHFVNRASPQRVIAGALPWARPMGSLNGRSGLSIASRWFLERGYGVLLPMEPEPYDLVAESDEGFKKIQVKTTRARDKKSQRYRVRLIRSTYRPGEALNSRGRVRSTTYTEDEVDFFFVITEQGARYLIPFNITDDRQVLVLDEKYAAFAVS